MPKTKLKPEIKDQELVSVENAYEILGRGYSRTSIYRRIESGEWKEGVHWVDDRRNGNQRRIIKINLTEVRKIRSTIAGER